MTTTATKDYKLSSRFYNIQKADSKRILIAILIAGILLRIFITFFTHLPHIHKDTPEYFQQAEALSNGGYINYFPNGYPLIIALGKMVFTNKIELFLLWTNILMATATLYFVYRISKTIFRNELLALLTTLLLALSPAQINIARWLTSEVPTTFFLTGAYFFYFRKRFLLTGLFMGITILIRTELILVFVLLTCCELLFLKKINFRFLIAAIIPLLLMGYYCYLKTGKFSISGHGKVNIMYSITASGNDVDYEYVHKHPEVVTDRDALNKYLEHVKEEPAKYTKERLANLFELWGIPSSSDGNRGLSSRLIMALSNFFLLVFGIVGWWKLRKDFNTGILIIPIVVITIVHTLLLAISRYTIPVEPFLTILATWTLLQLFRVIYLKNKYSLISQPSSR